MSEQNEELIALSASIVSAYVTRNNVPTTDLPRLIASTHAALAGLASPPAPVVAEPLVPAVPIRRSVTPDAIICLEDGRAFKSLKRHLSASYGMTPDQYRAKWNLPADYPMVAPNYAEARSALAKSMGLGRKGAAAARSRARS
jgi:predicted transcriptional regulator